MDTPLDCALCEVQTTYDPLNEPLLDCDMQLMKRYIDHGPRSLDGIGLQAKA